MAVPLIGVVGAYGATGAVVADTLAARGACARRLIGRDAGKLRAMADRLSGTPEVVCADVMNPDSLSQACASCHTIVNCAAPSTVVVDRVGLAAIAQGCHYVDAGGDARVYAALAAHNDEITARGLTFLLGAGYVPGLSELLVRAIYEVHRGRSTQPGKVRLFVVDRNEWSLNGFVDMMDRFCREPPEIGVYRDGTFERRSMLRAWVRRTMPGHAKRELLMPVRWHEIDHFIGEARPLQAAVYMPVDPLLYTAGRLLSWFAPNRSDLAARVAKTVFRLKAKKQGAGGTLYAEAGGRNGKAPLRWLIEVAEGRHYERTGQVAAMTAALIADGTIDAPGVRYLAHVVDPHDFIVRLLVWGVETIDLGTQDRLAAPQQAT